MKPKRVRGALLALAVAAVCAGCDEDELVFPGEPPPTSALTPGTPGTPGPTVTPGTPVPTATAVATGVISAF